MYGFTPFQATEAQPPVLTGVGCVSWGGVWIVQIEGFH